MRILLTSRVDALLDPASPFLELSPLAGHDVYPDPLPAAGLVAGIGESSRLLRPETLFTREMDPWTNTCL